LVAKGEVTPSELLEAAIERVEQSNPSLNAVVIQWFDHAGSVAADASGVADELMGRTPRRRLNLRGHDQPIDAFVLGT
jgi:Asp-tRNA(Asn)/Glu-tRNA(Gln) amidotransferase A subunit family amidase